MKLFDYDGLKTMVVNLFIDPENGFSKLGMTDKDGGLLYVPRGEEVTPLMGMIIENSEGAVFILGQDYHPRGHISFMINHPGIMQYRMERFREFLKEHGQPVLTDEELYVQCQQPVHFFDGYDKPPVPFPFPEIVLDENRSIMGLQEADGRMREVLVETSSCHAPDAKDRGRVAQVLGIYYPKTFDQYHNEGHLLSTQTLWTMHCVQGTPSCLYPDDMKLPKGLQDKLTGDLASMALFHRDAHSDNEFWVIRKGSNSEIDSYGIGIENDGKTLTKARDVFDEIAERLRIMGCEQVILNGGGLATNFCTEFSLNNTADFLAERFKARGMKTVINYVPEISRGIPIPGGEETPFSLLGTEFRLAKRGINTISITEILDLNLVKKPSALSVLKPGVA